jgi:hypothetical protein
MSDDKKKFDTIYDLKNQKKSALKSIVDSFITVDGKTFKDWLIHKQAIPIAKQMFLAAVNFVFYKNGSSGDSKISSSGNYDYTKHSKYSYIQEEETTSIGKVRDVPDYKHLPPIPPDKAERVINEVKSAIKSWGRVSVDQFYTLFGYTSTDPIDSKWGWDEKAFESAHTEPAPRGMVYLIVPDAKSFTLLRLSQ